MGAPAAVGTGEMTMTAGLSLKADRCGGGVSDAAARTPRHAGGAWGCGDAMSDAEGCPRGDRVMETFRSDGRI